MNVKVFRQPGKRCRRGFTLIEVAIAGTVAAFVMAGATALLVGLFRVNSTVRERLEQISIRSHLSDRFRADVADARSCTADDGKLESGILLRIDDNNRVRYIAEEHQVQRIAETGDRVTSRETFYLGDRRRVTLALTTDAVRLVRCTIEQAVPRAEQENPAAGATPRPALSIVAVLGRNRRLTGKIRSPAVPPKTNPDPAPSTELPSP